MSVNKNPGTDSLKRANRQGLEPKGDTEKLGISRISEKANAQLGRFAGITKGTKVDLTKGGRTGTEQSKSPVLHAPNKPGRRT
jgi:hypothetical protein